MSDQQHPQHEASNLLASPVEFAILASLDGNYEVEFDTLGHLVGSDRAALTEALQSLEQARFVKVTRSAIGGNPRVWFAATRSGKRAYAHQVEALEQIVSTG